MAARQVAGLTAGEVWCRYFALGGMAPLDTVRAFFEDPGPVELPDGDVLAHALNEQFAAQGLDYPVPYREDADGPGGGGPTVDDARMLAHASQLVPRLFEASTRLEPDALAALVWDEGRRAGLDETAVYLVDREQQVLAPLMGGERLEVDATLAGRAFQREQPVTLQRDDGRWVMWIPLLDGAERFGVLHLVSPFLSPDLLRLLERFAGAVAELVVSKSQYGDGLLMARRRQPMSLSAELRWPVLPPLTFCTDQLGIACVLEPAYDVAGDAFDYAMNRGTLHFAIFDAMGHGLEATQMANLALGAYRYARRQGMDLPATYRRIDAVLVDRFGGDRFVTAQLATLDSATGVIRWLSVGHPHPLVLRRGRVATELSADPTLPMGLGFDPGEPAVVSLEPGDHLLLFTDGVIDASSPGGEPFGSDRLVDLTIRALADEQTLAETVRRLVRSVTLHRDGPLDDDATVLLLHWAPSGRSRQP